MTDKQKFISVLENQNEPNVSYDKYEVEIDEDNYIVKINETGWVFDKKTEQFKYMFNYKW